MAGISASDKGPKPICYMVMPFRKKRVEEPLPAGAPAEIDFDALWEKAYWPAIKAMGYLPMRADFDSSSTIVKAMFERIAFADLVLADVTLGNGNVYYEVGIRHVAQETRCVLVAPNWTKPLFDISQFTSIRFTLKDGDINDDEAAAIRDLIVAKVPALIDSRTPYHELIGPSKDDSARRSAFRDFAESLNLFQGKVKAVREEGDKARRGERLAELLAEVQTGSLRIPEVALDLVALIRDTLGWKEMDAFVDTLPPGTRKLPFVREQDLLALAKLGDPLAAITQYEKLIEEQGDTAERRGLIGGRHKQLWKEARKAREAKGEAKPSVEESRQLKAAIESYTRGMELDYNLYYCSSNLPLLLRARNKSGDRERAAIVEHFVVAACERARSRDEQDEWLRPTLLGAAFRAGDLEKAAELADVVRLEGHATWKLETTIKDLEEALRQTEDPEKRSALQAIYHGLSILL
jgi:hypothetical protein